MFDCLVKPGNLGFYNIFECVTIFLIHKSSKKVINLFTIYVAEERSNIIDKETKLVDKLLRITDDLSLGAEKKYFSIEDTRNAYNVLSKFSAIGRSGLLDIGLGGEAIFGELVQHPNVFVSMSDTKKAPLTNVLKNVQNGSQVIEFFDASKEYTHYLNTNDEKETQDRIDKICELIYSVIPINLTSVQDRIGNIIFQFPSQILYPKFHTDKKDDDPATFNPRNAYVDYYFDDRAENKSYRVMVETTFDGLKTGFGVSDFSLEKCVNSVKISGLNTIDDNNVIIYDLESGLIVYSALLSILMNARLSTSISGTLTRKINGIEIGLINPEHRFLLGDKPNSRCKTLSRNRLHTNRLKFLKEKYYFKNYCQHGGNEREQALDDVRSIINLDAMIEEICLWDPYLDADDLIETLYYCRYYGVKMRAISSGNARILKRSGETSDFESWKAEQRSILVKTDSTGINLEFRCQHECFGYKFHDRFLIISYHNRKPRVWSLGKSVNSIGTDHHVIQEIEHAWHLLKDFNILWGKLTDSSCLIWKV